MMKATQFNMTTRPFGALSKSVFRPPDLRGVNMGENTCDWESPAKQVREGGEKNAQEGSISSDRLTNSIAELTAPSNFRETTVIGQTTVIVMGEIEGRFEKICSSITVVLSS
jgi:hypothetical protein